MSYEDLYYSETRPVSESALYHTPSKKVPGAFRSLQELALNSTPIERKSVTDPTLAADKRTDTNYTQELVDMELKGRISYTADAYKLIHHAFPESRLPAPIRKIHDGLSGESSKKKKQKKKKKAVVLLTKMLAGTNSSPFFKWVEEPVYKPDDIQSTLPPSDKNEEVLCRFMQRIVDASRPYFDVEPEEERIFTGKFCNRPLHSDESPIKRKPDITIFKKGVPIEDWERDDGNADWREVAGNGELKAIAEMKMTENRFIKEPAKALNTQTFVIFQAQEGRRFCNSITVTGGTCRFSRYSRAGVVHTTNFNIHEDSHLFLHLLIGLAFAPDDCMGLDPTLTTDEDGTRKVLFKGKEYTIISTVWRSAVICGRATTCWLVKDENGEEFIIKDYWVLSTRCQTKVEFLKMADEAGVEGIAKVRDWEDVMINGVLDSTDNIHGPQPEILNRVHRRILFERPSTPIYFFQSKKELVSAFLDYITTHEALVDNAKILHRDISLYNLMLALGTRNGQLIDLDYAKDLDEVRIAAAEAAAKAAEKAAAELSAATIAAEAAAAEAAEAAAQVETAAIAGKTKAAKAKKTSRRKSNAAVVADKNRKKKSEEAENLSIQDENIKKYNEMRKARGQRTGTHPFIASDILAKPSTVHTKEHDLESFYYVFLYIVSTFYGPDNRRIRKGAIPYFIDDWCHPERYADDRTLADLKNGHKALRDGDFHSDVIKALPPYMAKLGPCLTKLHTALRDPTQANVTHAYFKSVFEEAKEMLSDDESEELALVYEEDLIQNRPDKPEGKEAVAVNANGLMVKVAKNAGDTNLPDTTDNLNDATNAAGSDTNSDSQRPSSTSPRHATPGKERKLLQEVLVREHIKSRDPNAPPSPIPVVDDSLLPIAKRRVRRAATLKYAVPSLPPVRTRKQSRKVSTEVEDLAQALAQTVLDEKIAQTDNDGVRGKKAQPGMKGAKNRTVSGPSASGSSRTRLSSDASEYANASVDDALGSFERLSIEPGNTATEEDDFFASGNSNTRLFSEDLDDAENEFARALSSNRHKGKGIQRDRSSQSSAFSFLGSSSVTCATSSYLSTPPNSDASLQLEDVTIVSDNEFSTPPTDIPDNIPYSPEATPKAKSISKNYKLTQSCESSDDI